MGIYTGLRFKGIVKKEFRENFTNIAMHGEWGESTDKRLAAFNNISRAVCIPCGSLNDIPDEWKNSDDFNKTYDAENGLWCFQCSLKNYENTIEKFLELVPYFIEKIEHCEVLHELSSYSEKYELIENTIVLTNDKFIEYNNIN